MLVEWIEQNVDSRVKYTNNSNEIHICCPVCGETRYRLYINLVTGQLYCHNCQFHGTAVNLIKYINGVSYAEAQKIFNTIKGNIILPENIEDALKRRIMETAPVEITKRSIPLPEEFQLISTSHNAVATRAANYLQGRGITPHQIEQHRMGICATGEYHNRIIIPIYQEDKLMFWVARAMSGNVALKEKSPSNSFYQYGKSEVIFNLDQAAKTYRSIVISEGIFDALSWGRIGVSLLGKTLYDAQLSQLLSYRDWLTEGIYIALDADAERDAMKLAQTLSGFFDVKVIHIPTEFDDPNNYLVTHSKREMWNLITCADNYGEFTYLRSILQSL